jgi:hypothetical protein
MFQADYSLFRQLVHGALMIPWNRPSTRRSLKKNSKHDLFDLNHMGLTVSTWEIHDAASFFFPSSNNQSRKRLKSTRIKMLHAFPQCFVHMKQALKHLWIKAFWSLHPKPISIGFPTEDLPL